MSEIIENSAPLQTQFLPSKFVNRENERATLQSTLSKITETGSRNLHIYGPRGTGKTHITHSVLEETPSQVNTCYVLCSHHNTEYKALKRIYEELTKEEINTGYHVSDLQRKIEERTGAIDTVIVLDEIDFLLQNDGDSLLYYLSRHENKERLSIITISANHSKLPVEERTKSSLQTQQVVFPRYTGEEMYELLRQRGEDSLTSRSVHRNALTYIASKTSNAKIGLHLLQTAAENTDEFINEELVQEFQDQAYRKYVDQLLEPFTQHHKRVYQAIEELTEEQGGIIQSGDIYTHYQELCKAYKEDSLSQRRISDYLKHLELLNLIEADYHYGGSKGKTREINLETNI
jgi:orc1/cdc6 family replication initiation protein